MPGAGTTPKPNRRRRNVPQRGDWQPSEIVGWQHGPTPEPPDELLPASIEAWRVWMASWIAAHWTPTDLPGLRQLVRLYDQVERGKFVRAGELRMAMDNYGITPKGQQDRRWAPPKAEDEPKGTAKASGKFAHLKVVGE